MDALADTLAMLRLDVRMNWGTGYIEIRPWEGFEPDRILGRVGYPLPQELGEHRRQCL